MRRKHKIRDSCYFRAVSPRKPGMSNVAIRDSRFAESPSSDRVPSALNSKDSFLEFIIFLNRDVPPVRYAGDTAEPEDTLCDPLSRSRAACHSMNPLARSRCTESLPFSRLTFSFSIRIRCPPSPIILMVSKSLVKRLALTHLIPSDFAYGQTGIIIRDIVRSTGSVSREVDSSLHAFFGEDFRVQHGTARRAIVEYHPVSPSGIEGASLDRSTNLIVAIIAPACSRSFARTILSRVTERVCKREGFSARPDQPFVLT